MAILKPAAIPTANSPEFGYAIPGFSDRGKSRKQAIDPSVQGIAKSTLSDTSTPEATRNLAATIVTLAKNMTSPSSDTPTYLTSLLSNVTRVASEVFSGFTSDKNLNKVSTELEHGVRIVMKTRDADARNALRKPQLEQQKIELQQKKEQLAGMTEGKNLSDRLKSVKAELEGFEPLLGYARTGEFTAEGKEHYEKTICPAIERLRKEAKEIEGNQAFQEYEALHDKVARLESSVRSLSPSVHVAYSSGEFDMTRPLAVASARVNGELIKEEEAAEQDKDVSFLGHGIN